MRVLNPGWSRWPAWADIFPNHKAVPRIEAPLLVIHVSELQRHAPALQLPVRLPPHPLPHRGFVH